MLARDRILVQPLWDDRHAWYAPARARAYGVEVVSFAFPQVLNDPPLRLVPASTDIPAPVRLRPPAIR